MGESIAQIKNSTTWSKNALISHSSTRSHHTARKSQLFGAMFVIPNFHDHSVIRGCRATKNLTNEHCLGKDFKQEFLGFHFSVLACNCLYRFTVGCTGLSFIESKPELKHWEDQGAWDKTMYT